MSDFRTRYAALVAAGEIESDPAQVAVARHFDRLEDELEERNLSGKSSALGWLFGKREKKIIRGLYIYGEVGRGKTMLMDLFFETSKVARKRRVHFHEFMADVHDRMAHFRRASDDPVSNTAAALAEEAWLLCFDEFHVTDIADAMILGRLFTQLFERGIVVVATSNIAPDGLYRDGLNRALFVPFIAMLEKHCEVLRLEARTDFRLEKLTGMPVWHVPDDAKAQAALDQAWRSLTGGQPAAAQDLVVKGHKVHIPRTAMGVARFAFEDLCGRPLGASDYLRIAHEFHTLIVDHIPLMSYERRNEAKRFIILIDTLYDHAVKLIASAQAEPDALYSANRGNEAIEFNRTASRLMEMRSQEYLGLPHGPRAPQAPLASIVET